MPDVGGVGGRGIPPQNQNQAAGKAGAAASQPNAPVGQPGSLGQPMGIPVPAPPGSPQIMPDVLAGRDASQMLAAERMREAGGASATEQLLGLNRQPSILGAFAPPPGNSEALRHMTPTMRRTIMRGLLDKQRTRMRRLAHLVSDERGDGERRRDEDDDARELFAETLARDETEIARARGELNSTAQLLDLLDELLALQDYTLSQMGTFSQG